MRLKPLNRLRRSRTYSPRPSEEEAAPWQASSHRHRWLVVLAVVAGVFLAVRFVGSPIATSMVNRKLAELPEVAGHAEGVHLALWRGAVVVEDLVIYARGHEDDRPLMHLRHASMRLAPSALFSGKLGGSVTIDGAEFNVVKRERGDDSQQASDETARKLQEVKAQAARWQDTLRQTFPLELAKLELKNARVRFLDLTRQPHPEMEVNDLRIVATDLQNRPKANGDPYPAKIQVHAVTSGNGQFEATVQADPMAEQPRFTANFGLRAMQLPPVNNFLRAYADVDVSRGSFELFSEVDAKEGRYEGYVKPLFHDLDFRTASDENKNPLEKVKEKVVSAVTGALENDNREQVATKAPFSGNFGNNQVDIWATISTLFSNAFVQALRGGFENQSPST